MKREVQVGVSIPLRGAIWNWIEIFPAEFNDAIRNRGRMEGAPERVFDLLYMCQTGNEKVLWPTLTALNCISSDRFSSDFQMNHFGSGPGHIGGLKSNRKVGLLDGCIPVYRVYNLLIRKTDSLKS
jgi:hypothetical protein